MTPYILATLALAALLILFSLRQVIVYEYERGVLYRRGHFVRVLRPGSYWFFPRFSAIARVDVRLQYVAVPSQELCTSDGATIKITIAATYKVLDPNVAINEVQGYQGAVYSHLQLALREIISGETVESLLAARPALGKRLVDLASPKVTALGVSLSEAEIKDVMFPAELKRAYAQVLKAKQDGLAALERARGETAALRHLANAAGMLEERPALMQLRLLQVLGQTSGNTVVLGANAPGSVVPVRQGAPAAASPNTPDV